MDETRGNLRIAACAVVLNVVLGLALTACGGSSDVSGASTAGSGGGGPSGGGSASGGHLPGDPCALVTARQMAAVVGVGLQTSNQAVKTTCDYAPTGASTNIVATVAPFAQTADGWSLVKSASQQSATQSPGSGLEFQPVSEPAADAFFGGDTITAFKDGVQINVWIGQMPGLGSGQLADSPALLAAETIITGDALSQV